MDLDKEQAERMTLQDYIDYLEVKMRTNYEKQKQWQRKR